MYPVCAQEETFIRYYVRKHAFCAGLFRVIQKMRKLRYAGLEEIRKVCIMVNKAYVLTKIKER